MLSGRFLRPILSVCALVACDADSPSDTPDTRPQEVEPDTSPDATAPEDATPDIEEDTAPPLQDTEADTAPPPQDTTADTEADTAPPPDTSPPDDAVTIDPDELAFIPGAYNAFSADAPFEIIDVFAVNPGAPAAEDAIGFRAMARTTASNLTVATNTGDRTFAFGDAGVVKDITLSFDPSGQIADAEPTALAERAVRYGQCWVFAGALNTGRAVTPHYRTFGSSWRGNIGDIRLPDDTPVDIEGTFATADGRAYAVVISALPIEVTYANGVAVVMPGTGEPSTYFVALDAPPVGTTSATDVITLVPRVQLMDLVGGDAGRFYFLGDAAAAPGSAGGPGTPRTIGVYHVDLLAGARAIATPTWKCGDACTQPSLEGNQRFCAMVDHFRPADPTNPGTTAPAVVLTGMFQGRLDLPSGPLETAGTEPEPFVIVFDGDGNPRIGRKGGGMSVERVGFDATGDVILGGTFSDTAALIDATAVGTRDAFIGVFDPATLAPKRSMTHGAPDLETALVSNWLTPEARGDCTATGAVGGFALRQGDDLVIAALGDNGVGCVGEPMPGNTQLVNGVDGNAFFVLPEGDGIPFTGVGPDGLPQSMVWPPVADWQQTAGSSRARVMNNAR